MLRDIGETKDESGHAMTQRGKVIADENGHRVKRAVTVGQDQLLSLSDDGEELTVATTEFYVLKEVGDLHCTCGEMFDDHEEVKEHLKNVRGGLDD